LITTADSGYPIVYANPQFRLMTGYNLAELVGQSPKMFQGEKTNPIILQRLKQALENGEHFHGATINYKKNGDPYPVEWNISTIFDDNQKITHYLSIQKDLSHLKNVMSLLKQTNEHFREFLIDISRTENRPTTVTHKQKQFVTEVLDNARVYNSALRSDENIGLFGEDEFFDCSNGTNGILSNKIVYNKISALDYNLKYNVKLDVHELSQIVREAQDKIDLLTCSKNSSNECVEIAELIREIANEIFYLDEFFEISSTLIELSNKTHEYSKQSIDLFIIEIFRGLMTDLDDWLNTTFIQQTAADVHQQDASIISSAKQLMQFLH
jgi:PAS domain S-box-containing protein